MLFSTAAAPVFIPPTVQTGSLFSTSTLTFVICALLGDRHSDMREGVCHSDFISISLMISDLCSFPRQTIQYHGNPSLCPNQ